jgi:hypothetical protein
MPTPIEAYRQGFEKGRSDSAGGRLAEMAMGMLHDDPGGHFQKGYSDGAAGKPFNPPSIPTPSRLRTNGLIPKFSENPSGWFLSVLIVIEVWALWQLIKAPFQLVGSLMRSEKPSPSVIVKNVIVAGLAIAVVWWVPHVNEMRGPVGYTQAVQPTQAPVSSGSNDDPLSPSIAALLPPNSQVIEWADLAGFAGKPRTIVLWMLNPQRSVRTSHGDQGCSESVTGDYWYGQTRLSLINAGTRTVLNTIEVREDLWGSSKDSFSLPFLVSNQYYYVAAPTQQGEGKPTILYFRRFTDASALAFPLFVYESCGNAQSSAFGYSKSSDHVLQFPVEMRWNNDPPKVEFWAGVFDQTPTTLGHWAFDRQPNHGSETAMHGEVSFDGAAQRFVATLTMRRVAQ